jgi:hypothetical protein
MKLQRSREEKAKACVDNKSFVVAVQCVQPQPIGAAL